MRPVVTSPEIAQTQRRRFGGVASVFHHHPALYSLVGLVLLCVAMVFLSDEFLTTANLSNILRQVSINAIIAAGMTTVILAGGIDLSVGAVMALSMTAAAGAMLAGVPIPLAIFVALAIGLLCGAVNGMLVAYLGLPAIIVTLAMMEIPRGSALLYTKGYPLSGLPPGFSFWGRGQVLGVQTPIIAMLMVYGVGYVMLNHYPVGRYIYGIGGNEEAVRLSGVRVRRYKFLTYVISGLTAAISGVVLASRLMSGQPNAGEGFELDAIAQGTAIVTRHRDVPGMVGRIGTILGQAHVNISTMQVARTRAGGEAMMLLEIDPAGDAQFEIPHSVLGAIASVPDVTAVHPLYF